MKKAFRLNVFSLGTALATTVLLLSQAGAQTPPEPGLLPGIELTNLSHSTPKQFAAFPLVAVNRGNPNLVAVAWRLYNAPTNTGALEKDRQSECHVSISKDGGKNFTHPKLLPYFQTKKEGDDPHFWGCNAPWVNLATDGTIYVGGSLFSGVTGMASDPRQGRAGVSVSTDGGASWSKMAYGITIANFAPGVKGLGGGMTLIDTPFDGANGVVDPITGTFYSTVGGWVSASSDKGKSFSPVYSTGGGTLTAAFGVAATAHIVNDTTTFPGAQCPCLAFGQSTDKGQTWKHTLVAEKDQFNPTGTVRYPVTAADPAHRGHFAIAVYAPDHQSVKVYYTADDGKNWKVAAPKPGPATVPVANVNMTSPGYTSDGHLLVTWRAFNNMGAFNTFVAMMEGDSFGPTVKVSAERSAYPVAITLGNYLGDFSTWVQGNDSAAFVAFPYAPGGAVLDVYLAKVPLSLLK